MNCEPVREQLPLFIYGELSFDEEEAVESHLEGCADCSAALDRERQLMAAFDQVAVEPSSALLRACRENLAERLAQETSPIAVEPKIQHISLWDRFVDTITMPMTMLRPAGAVALVAFGFIGARLIPAGMPGLGSNLSTMSMADVGASRVRSVEPAANGTVRIVLDETRQRTVDGSMDDQAIRELLLGATKDPSDDGLRIETVALLTTRPGTADVRDALIDTMRNDQNAGVRLKALEGLQSFAGEADVRSALADVLSSDANPAMRIRAIDLLVKNLNESADKPADRRIVGVFQELLSREKDPYMRQLSQHALDLMNASSEVY